MLNYLSSIQQVLRQARPLYLRSTTTANYSKDIKDDTTVYNEDEEDKQNREEYMVDLVDNEEREREIQRMRNKSRLSKAHRNYLFSIPTSNDELSYDRSLQNSRSQYGTYGAASGVDPRMCFETPEERADHEEYERVAYPFTVLEMMERGKQEKIRRKQANDERQKQVVANVVKLDKWMKDMADRLAKKEEQVRVAKDRREQFMEEIRLELGFSITRRDPRYQEMLQKKEDEHKKEKKKLKKLAEAEKKEQSLQRQYQKLQQAADDENAEPKKENEEATDGNDEKEIGGNVKKANQ